MRINEYFIIYVVVMFVHFVILSLLNSVLLCVSVSCSMSQKTILRGGGDPRNIASHL